MASRLLMILTVVLLAGGVQIADAQRPKEPAYEVKQQTGTSYASLITERSGRHTLVIDYPWKRHQRPSVEVRLVRLDAENPSEARPIYFVKDYLKGDVTVNVYHTQDASASVATSRLFEENEIEFEILGRRNSFGKPSVCIARNIAPDDDPAPGAAGAYCLLDSWSLSRRLLNLDLPPQYFSRPGKLHVWFLREGKVLWEEIETWPGYKAETEKDEKAKR